MAQKRLGVMGVAGLLMAAACASAQAAPKPAAPAPEAAKPVETPEVAKPKVDPDQGRKDAAEKVKRESEAAAKVPVLSYTMTTIDGEAKKLSEYKGKVLLIVNTASRCGFTAQYAGLEQLYNDKKSLGLEILAFPANNFGGQEPGTDAEIKSFCTGEQGKYKVTFPLFSKISVTGEDQHPLYETLAAQPSPIGGDPKWNFTKFLVDRDGKVVARFESRIRPDDAELIRKINQLLDQAPTAAAPTDAAADGATGAAENPAAGSDNAGGDAGDAK
jgi:glutathione peroxidase